MKGCTEEQILTWMRNQVESAAARRKWSELPADFEARAVTCVYMDIKKHFGKYDVRRRIDASKCCTFADLRAVLAP